MERWSCEATACVARMLDDDNSEGGFEHEYEYRYAEYEYDDDRDTFLQKLDSSPLCDLRELRVSNPASPCIPARQPVLWCA